MLPQLQSNDTEINPLGRPVTSYEISLIMGFFAIGSTISPLFCVKLADIFGRKNLIIFTSILNMISLSLLAFTTNIIWLYITRTVSGVVLGMLGPILAIFLSEITDDHNRGKFGCFSLAFMPFGQLYGYLMGYFFSVKYFTITCLIPLILHTLLMVFFVPESPVHLLQQGRTIEAVSSLTKYRGNLSAEEIEKDIRLIKCTPEQTMNQGGVRLRTLVTHQPTRKGLFIGLGMFVIQFGTGIGIIQSFLGPIFEEAQTSLSGNMTAILVGSLKLIIFLGVAQIVNKCGRKFLMFFSALLCSISLFCLGLYFFLKDINFGLYKNFTWLPLMSIIFFIFAYSVGLGCIPFATIGELFDNNIRSTAVSTIMFITRIVGSVVYILYPIVVKFIRVWGCMWIFSGICGLGTIFIYVVVPETQGKSFNEIQEILRGKKNTSENLR